MIAEDELNLADCYVMLLHQWDCETVVARAGVDAVRRAATFRPDVALLSGVMPNMDGVEAGIRLVDIKSLAVEKWLRSLDLAAPTRGKTKYVMTVVFLHAEKYDRIPDGFTVNLESKIEIETSSDYEAVILTPEQTFTIL